MEMSVLTMSAVALVMLCAASSGVTGWPHPPTTMATTVVSAAYDSKFDNVDVDEILSQERLLNNYIKCLESTGPCTSDAKMLKEILPDAMQTDCAKCTEKQKSGANKVTRHLIDYRPKDWERLEKIYDPQGTYRTKYLESKKPTNSNTDPMNLDQGDS